jgi:hypothetical protein
MCLTRVDEGEDDEGTVRIFCRADGNFDDPGELWIT